MKSYIKSLLLEFYQQGFSKNVQTIRTFGTALKMSTRSIQLRAYQTRKLGFVVRGGGIGNIVNNKYLFTLHVESSAPPMITIVHRDEHLKQKLCQGGK